VYQSYGADGKENTTNEELLGKAVKRFGREKFVIATKFGIGNDPVTGARITSGKPDFIRGNIHKEGHFNHFY
jgi:aryl-alcohol dehydrogenase-like predicted oxidoreductase